MPVYAPIRLYALRRPVLDMQAGYALQILDGIRLSEDIRTVDLTMFSSGFEGELDMVLGYGFLPGFLYAGLHSLRISDPEITSTNSWSICLSGTGGDGYQLSITTRFSRNAFVTPGPSTFRQLLPAHTELPFLQKLELPG